MNASRMFLMRMLTVFLDLNINNNADDRAINFSDSVNTVSI